MHPDDLTGAADLLDLYRGLHREPELAFAEVRTAARMADALRGEGLEVHEHVGRTGVVGLLRHGDGPTVLLRADLDALPVRESTGAAYASTATDASGVPLMHACGHDLHLVAALGAVRALVDRRATWRGTLVVVLQPAEEIGAGARAMLDDGLLALVPAPAVVLAQHVDARAAGTVHCTSGPAMASADTLAVRLFGRGGHASQPHRTVDPVLLAATTIARLHTLVGREVEPWETAVLTVGSVHAGTAANVTPDTADLQVNVRALDPRVRVRLLDAVARVVRAEADAAGSTRPPLLTPGASFPLLVNDPAAVAATMGALASRRGVPPPAVSPPSTISEDVGLLAAAAGCPLVLWFLGSGADDDAPVNHSGGFLPDPEPTLRAGVAALTTAALHHLGAPRSP